MLHGIIGWFVGRPHSFVRREPGRPFAEEANRLQYRTWERRHRSSRWFG